MAVYPVNLSSDWLWASFVPLVYTMKPARIGHLLFHQVLMTWLMQSFWLQTKKKRCDELIWTNKQLVQIDWCECIIFQISDRSSQASTHGNLAVAYQALGAHDRALQHYLHHLTIARELRDVQSEARALGKFRLIKLRQPRRCLR